MKTDILIVGAGPAGIFTAIEMLRHGCKQKIVIVEKGKAVEDRSCPKAKTGHCMNCKPYCHITTGFSGAGAFSDGKLSLSCDVGGDLPQLLISAQIRTLRERKLPMRSRRSASAPSVRGCGWSTARFAILEPRRRTGSIGTSKTICATTGWNCISAMSATI